MGRRVITHGRGQALDGDKTTTGAKCISSLPNVKNCGKGVVRLGDRTTVCPKCSKPGTIITGELSVSYGGSPAAVDGSFVMCGCPMGTNRVKLLLGKFQSVKNCLNHMPTMIFFLNNLRLPCLFSLNPVFAGWDVQMQVHHLNLAKISCLLVILWQLHFLVMINTIPNILLIIHH
ncbi:PAAR domain-containing protein [Salmonella enterica]|nr:PAAR domain-containing protein [Salmonella enterica]EDP9793299.1 PAAR domain-containing protein [Salmonella enterica subsp. salamae]EEE0987139.1 PAAR domain-containing protein [Salmonella enterica subsp. enterica serovar Kiambu]EEI0026847.1 hypothetical protein [Salmonella enterica subsp. houtenae]EBA6825102.1 PAAR domain-containing protein [Salmonella enterica]